MSIQLLIVRWCESFPKDKGGFSKEIHLPLEYKHTSTLNTSATGCGTIIHFFKSSVILEPYNVNCRVRKCRECTFQRVCSVMMYEASRLSLSVRTNPQCI